MATPYETRLRQVILEQWNAVRLHDIAVTLWTTRALQEGDLFTFLLTFGQTSSRNWRVGRHIQMVLYHNFAVVYAAVAGGWPRAQPVLWYYDSHTPTEVDEESPEEDEVFPLDHRR
jgi:hypothetical protein